MPGQIRTTTTSRILTLLLVAAPLCAAMGGRPAVAAVPQLDHVVLIVMENHAYQQVASFPYTVSLMGQGSRFTASYAVTHPSQPNYIALWSGGLHGVTDNSCPVAGFPLMAENLGHACEAAGISWRAYSEALPAPGSTVCNAGSGNNIYVRKHAPWTSFGNLDHQNERPFTDLAADIAADALPRLAVIIPDQCHNTHDCALQVGDDWLAANVPGLLTAVGPNGVVILTWDEDDSFHANHVLTVFAGAPIKANYTNTRTVTHYTHLRTICEMLGLPPFGNAQNEVATDDIFVGAVSGSGDPSPGPPVQLHPPTPNPSRGTVSLVFDVVEEGHVTAALFDVAGRPVRRLWEGAQLGRRTLTWDGTDDAGRRAPAGLYLLRVQSGSGRFEQKLLRLAP